MLTSPTGRRRRVRARWAGRTARRQGGQVVPLVAVVLVLAGVLGLALAQTGRVLARREAAQSAADAAALAGAADGPQAARSVAAANGARLVSYRAIDLDVVVSVTRRGIRATARARWDPTGAAPVAPGRAARPSGADDGPPGAIP